MMSFSSTFLPEIIYLTLIIQVILISIFLSNKWSKNKIESLSKYPPEQYPNLYVQTASVELSRVRLRKNFDRFIVAFCLISIGYLFFTDAPIEQVSLAVKYILALQLIPWFISSYWSKENSKLMAKNFPSTKRKSSFEERKITLFVSHFKFALTMISYLSTLCLTAYILINTLWLENSHKALYLLGLNTLMVGFLLWLLFISLYGKKKDNFIENDDRINLIANKCQVLTTFIMLYSIFIFAISFFKTFEVNTLYIDVMTSVFVQIVLFISVYNHSEKNHEVYK